MLEAKKHYREHPVFSPGECAEIIRIVDSLREHWENRREGLPFFTLGTASYLDASADSATCTKPFSVPYIDKAAKSNALLKTHFEPYLTTLRNHLAHLFLQPIEDLPDAAIPGFHIFEAHPAFARPMASVHFDYQYKLLRWPAPLEVKSAFSFTLPLELPAAGGGLRYWHLTPGSLARHSVSKQKEIIEQTPPEFLPYTTGSLVIHSGHLLHQIAPAAEMRPLDRRITWQGHGGVAEGRVFWYW